MLQGAQTVVHLVLPLTLLHHAIHFHPQVLPHLEARQHQTENAG
jgi:hypothetical protein